MPPPPGLHQYLTLFSYCFKYHDLESLQTTALNFLQFDRFLTMVSMASVWKIIFYISNCQILAHPARGLSNKDLFEASSLRSQTSFMRVLVSWPTHLSEAPFLIPSFNKWILWRLTYVDCSTQSLSIIVYLNFCPNLYFFLVISVLSLQNLTVPQCQLDFYS